MIVLKTHYVPDQISQIRLVDYVVKILPDYPSRSAIKKAIKRGEILLDNRKADQAEFVKPGQEIVLVDLQKKIPKVFELILEVIYEDEFLAVINKPAGVSVSGNKFKTVLNALPLNLKPSNRQDALTVPLPVHRLDYATSGSLLIAKTRLALTELGKQFENRQVKKHYQAVVVGKIDEQGVIDFPVDELEAYTEYRLVKSIPSLKVETISLVDLFPKTGRTHQLRKHMAGIGHPIVGDSKYGNDFPILKGKGLFLAAIGLSFKDPFNQKEQTFQISMPAKFESLLEREERRWKKYHLSQIKS